jgi:hypothetical protein
MEKISPNGHFDRENEWKKMINPWYKHHESWYKPLESGLGGTVEST